MYKMDTKEQKKKSTRVLNTLIGEGRLQCKGQRGLGRRVRKRIIACLHKKGKKLTS